VGQGIRLVSGQGPCRRELKLFPKDGVEQAGAGRLAVRRSPNKFEQSRKSVKRGWARPEKPVRSEPVSLTREPVPRIVGETNNQVSPPGGDSQHGMMQWALRLPAAESVGSGRKWCECELYNRCGRREINTSADTAGSAAQTVSGGKQPPRRRSAGKWRRSR
jgi:hypothetical protein